MDYPQALTAMLQGKKVTREAWNGRKLGQLMFTSAQFPDSGSMNTKPYLYMVVGPSTPISEDYSRTPWHPSNPDQFSNDWSEVINK